MTEPISNSSAAKIRDALEHGNKIEAIKLYREQFGVGLREAKDAVEQLEADLGLAEADVSAAGKGRGCSAALLAFVFLLTASALSGLWLSRI